MNDEPSLMFQREHTDTGSYGLFFDPLSVEIVLCDHETHHPVILTTGGHRVMIDADFEELCEYIDAARKEWNKS